MNYNLDIQAYGDKGILINWPNKIDTQISENLLLTKKHLESKYSNDLVDTSNGYQSLLLYFKNVVTQKLVEEIALNCKEVILEKVTHRAKIWEIPVCYDVEFGIDLRSYLNHKKLSLNQLIQLHTKPVYHVYGKGFLPGFLYLGGLDEKLSLDRKRVPSLKIPKNSVAIGGEQTGVYPTDSPGGWHIIGKTPKSLFDVHSNFANNIQAGDKVSFKSISKAVFFEMEQLNTLKSDG